MSDVTLWVKVTFIVTQWRNAFYEKWEMQTLGQVATGIDTEYYSLGKSTWHLLLMIKLWPKYVKVWNHILCNIQHASNAIICYNQYNMPNLIISLWFNVKPQIYTLCVIYHNFSWHLAACNVCLVGLVTIIICMFICLTQYFFKSVPLLIHNKKPCGLWHPVI